jgi:bifunctional N-acetylglucosamine-1-phosphate-uridyltransferase/glucosamine-1-phosphate-acetyltransferase GlmU-like protein
MIDHLFDLYAPFVDRFVLVLHPSFIDSVRSHCANNGLQIDYEVQVAPTGMLDAILIPEEKVRHYSPNQIWITWCDQVAVYPDTVRRLSEAAGAVPQPAMVMPTVIRSEPYIHLVRNASEEVVDILHRREGDSLPDPGEGDLGLFCLSRHAYMDLLPKFSNDVVTGHSTRERNFLPFIPWLTGKAPLVTFPASHPIESIGINDAADLRQIEHHWSHEGEALGHHSRL